MKIDYNTYKRPTDYAQFKEGDTRIRVISEGFIGMNHGLRTANRWVNLGTCTEDDKCEHCLKGNTPKRFWRWVIVNRETDEVLLLDAGIMLGDGICQIAITTKEDPQKYDLFVTRTGLGLRTKYYVAKAKDNKEFSTEDVARWKNKKKILINKYLV